MRVHGIMKVATTLLADFVWICLTLGPEAAAAATAGIMLYAWLGEYIALFKNEAIPPDQLDTYERSRLLRIQEYLSEDVRRISGANIAGLKLCVLPSDSMNAYAYGFSHVSITRAMLRSCDDTTLCAVLGHEISHILHMDAVFHRIVFANVTIAVAGLTAASFISVSVLWILFILLCAFGICGGLFSVLVFHGAGKLARGLFTVLQHGVLFAYGTAMGAISRRCEFRADLYSCQLGYGPQLSYFLTRFADGQETRQRTLSEILYASHPSACKRVMRIEQFSTGTRE